MTVELATAPRVACDCRPPFHSTACAAAQAEADRDAVVAQLEALAAHWTSPVDNACVTCGKRCPSGRKARHVQISMDGTPLPLTVGDLGGDAMGHFPVGSSCAKRWPDGYLTDLEPIR